MRDSRRFSRGKKRLFVLVLLLFYAVLLEILLRAVFPVPEVLNFNRINYSPLDISPEDTPGYLENISFTYVSEPDGRAFVHHLNLYGFRDKTWSLGREAGRQRVMFIGDSFVEGFMASDAETIPAGYERAAAANNLAMETINLGVGAGGLREYGRLISDAVPLFRPEYLFVILYANDFLGVSDVTPGWLEPSFVPRYARFATPRLYHIIHRLRAGQTVPSAWGGESFPFIPAVPDPRNPWSSEKNAASYEKYVTPGIAEAMKRGRFNPYLMVNYMLLKKGLRNPVNILSYLQALKAFVEEYSCRLVVGYIPSRHQVSDAYLPFARQYSVDKHPTSLMADAYQVHARQLAGTCTRLDIPFLDMTPLLARRETGGERLFWDYDDHMRGKGYLLVGEHLFDWFVKNEAGIAGPSR